MKAFITLQDQYTRMRPSDRRALVLMTLFLTLVAGYVFLLEPLMLGYQQAHRQLDELVTQERGYRQKIRMLPRREAKWAEYSAALDQLRRQFDTAAATPEAAISNIISELSRYARLCGVRVSGIRPLDVELVGSYSEIPVELEVDGDYAGLHKFFYFIETSASLLAITDLELRPQQADQLRARLKLSNITHHKQAEPETERTVRVGQQNHLRLIISPWIGHAPLIIAQRNGYLQTQEYRVDLIQVDDVLAAEHMLLSGGGDGLAITLPGLLRLMNKGIPLAVVSPLASTSGTEGVVVSADSGIRTLEDLRARQVGVDTGGVMQFVLFHILQKQGLQLSELTLLERPAGLVAREIRAGTLEAGMTREPYLSSLLDSGQARLLGSSDGMEDPVLDVVAASPDSLERKNGTWRFLLQGLSQAQAYLAQHPREAARYIAEWQAQPVDLTRGILSRIGFFDKQRTESFFASLGTGSLTKAYEDFFQSTGQPFPRVEKADIMDDSLFHRSMQGDGKGPEEVGEHGGS